MSASGYIKLWRQAQKSAVWQAGDGVWMLWCCLLMRASHKPRNAVVNLGRHTVVVGIQAGEYIIRERLLAADLKIDRKTLRRRLAVLAECRCVDFRKAKRNLSVATIRNWDRYQTGPTSNAGRENGPVSPPVSGPVSPPHHKKTKKTKRETRTRFVPPTPEQVEEYGRSIGFQVNGQTFVDHYEGTHWRRGKGEGIQIRDWRACVRTWKSRDQDRNGQAKQQSIYPDL